MSGPSGGIPILTNPRPHDENDAHTAQMAAATACHDAATPPADSGVIEGQQTAAAPAKSTALQSSSSSTASSSASPSSSAAARLLAASPPPESAGAAVPSLKRARPGSATAAAAAAAATPSGLSSGVESDPVALELGGQVERLLQARLLRAAQDPIHGVSSSDGGTPGLPLLDVKDRTLLYVTGWCVCRALVRKAPIRQPRLTDLIINPTSPPTHRTHPPTTGPFGIGGARCSRWTSRAASRRAWPGPSTCPCRRW